MRAPPSSSAPSLTEAYALLGLDGPVEAEALTAAFRAAVKAARPDRPEGDEARFRQIIAGYRLIQATAAQPLRLAAPRRRPAPAPVVRLTPLQAVRGAQITLSIGGRRLKVAVPPGLRTGEHLRLKQAGARGEDVYPSVLIQSGGGLTVIGDDLYMSWPTPERLLSDGGRVEIDTHAGRRDAWVVGGLEAPVRLALRGLGLPARGRKAAGRLFVKLEPCADTPSAAEDLLARFTRVWTPSRIAA